MPAFDRAINFSVDQNTFTQHYVVNETECTFGLLLLLGCHGDAVRHVRTASCIPSIVFCPQPRVLPSDNHLKCYQWSTYSVVLGVCFREHHHTGLSVAIGKVAFWLYGRSI